MWKPSLAIAGPIMMFSRMRLVTPGSDQHRVASTPFALAFGIVYGPGLVSVNAGKRTTRPLAHRKHVGDARAPDLILRVAADGVLPQCGAGSCPVLHTSADRITQKGRTLVAHACLAGLGMTQIKSASACEHKRVQTSANNSV